MRRSVTILSDYSRLHIQTNGVNIPRATYALFFQIVAKVFATRFFHCSYEVSISIYPSNSDQLWKISWLTAHIADTNENRFADEITKIRKAIRHLGLIRTIISGIKSEMAGTQCPSFPMDKDETRLMIATDRPSDNLIVTMLRVYRLLHKMTVSMINCALWNAIFT